MKFNILATLACLFTAVALSSGQLGSDNDLYPPVNLPRSMIQQCDFNSRETCKLFFNSARNKINFEEGREDVGRKTRTARSNYYITTGRGASGTAKYTSKFLTPSSGSSGRKALCLSFFYRLKGNGKIALAEQPRGQSKSSVFWRDVGRDKSLEGKWRFHTSQVSSDVDVKIEFRGNVQGGMDSVAIRDITLYKYTCQIKDGDTFKPYVGASRTLTDAPYWPANATVPYEIQPGFTVEQKEMIERFFRETSTRTCVRFVPRRRKESSFMNFVHVDPGRGCASSLGNVGETMLAFEDDCFVRGYSTIAHMAFHGLGLRHEHVRPDRDTYVEVFTDRVNDSRVIPMFNRRPTGNNAVLALPYDFKSVLHFGNKAFAKDHRNTIQKRNDPQFQLSNTDGPTALDYEKLAAIYCGGTTKSPTTPRPRTTPAPRPPPQRRGCQRTRDVTRISGLIRNSPNGATYHPGERCGWRIRVQQYMSVQLEFTSLDLEDSAGCVNDKVTIYDGGDEFAPVIVQLCGTNRPPESYVSSENEVLVMFETNDDIEAAGFALRYRQIDPYDTPDSGPVADATLSPVDCNFEQSACNWVQGSGQLKWTRRKLNNLPHDHSTQSDVGYYLSLDAAPASGYGQFALLKSSQVKMEDDFACLSFYYRFLDRAQDIGDLQVFYVNEGNVHPLWSSADNRQSSQKAYSDWVQAHVDLLYIPGQLDYFRLIFNGTVRSPNKIGGIAVDDVIMTQDECGFTDDNTVTPDPWGPEDPTDDPWGPDLLTTAEPNNPVDPWLTTESTTAAATRPSPSASGNAQWADGTNGYSCEFESNNCNWVDSMSKADSRWRSASGRSTPGSNYGVQHDHTKQTPSGKYLVLNSVANQKKIARLEVSVPASGNFKCFELYYLMYGKHLGRLRIIAKKRNDDGEMVVFEANGNKQPKWTQAQASLETLNGDYTLIVEGYTTGQSSGDIGIDDFLLRTNECYSAPLPALPPTTPYVTPNNPYICDFEDGALCLSSLQFQSIGRNGNYKWQDMTARRAVSFGGPENDHSRRNPEGHLAVVRGGPRNSQAVLRTKMYTRGEVNCMNFWYYMRSSSQGALRVSIVPEGSRERQVMMITRQQGNVFADEWTNPQVTLPRTDGRFRIKFTAISGGSNSFIGLDDVEISRNSKCSKMSRVLGMGKSADEEDGSQQLLVRERRQARSKIFACRFGNNDFCSFRSSGTWMAVKTSVNQDTAGHDDRFAHLTSGRLTVARGNARAMSLPSAAMTSNITGSLTSPMVDVSRFNAKQACLRFFYKISGWFRDLPMDTLNVFVEPRNNLNQRRLVATLSGSMTPPTDSLDDWLEQKLTIFESGNYKVIFEATTGDSWLGSIAIDDVQLRNSVCPDISNFDF